MKSILSIGQLVVAIVIIVLVLLQEGGGLSQAFGGSDQSFHVRRGLEKMTFWATTISAILFVGLSIWNLAI